MKINYAKSFHKAARKLSRQNSLRVLKALSIFEKNPFDPSLQNHKLKGVQKDQRSISAGYDLRIIYREQGNHAIVLCIDVGTHKQVYGR